MEALVQDKASCVLRRIDIDTWGSDVARQFGIRSLPTLWLYDGENRVSTDAREVFGRVHTLE